MDRWLRLLDSVEIAALRLVAKIAPWLPLIPTAWLVFDRGVRYLGLPLGVAAAAAVAVEALGVLTTLTVLELYSYNQDKLASEPAAPLWLPAGLVAVYLIVAELLTLGLDMAPRLEAGEPPSVGMITPAAFPVLGLVGMLILAVRYDHLTRLRENTAAAEKRKRGRKVTKSAEKSQSPRESRQVRGAWPVTWRDWREVDQARARALAGAFGTTDFSRPDAELALGLQSTATSKLLAALVFLGNLEALGAGRSRRYRFLDPPGALQNKG